MVNNKLQSSTQELLKFLFNEVKDYIKNDYKCPLYQKPCIYKDIEEIINSFHGLSEQSIYTKLLSFDRDTLIDIVKRHKGHKEKYFCQ